MVKENAVGKQRRPNDDSSEFKLVGFKKFIRNNPNSDLFSVKDFHHLEFWCADATSATHRFSWGLGLPIVAKSDLSTGNFVHASYLLGSGDMKMLFTAPYSPNISNINNPSSSSSSATIPTFSNADHHAFISSHGGLAVRAIAIEVTDVFSAFSVALSRGAIPIHSPILLDHNNSVILAELQLYGDVVLRLISYKSCHNNNFLPGFEFDKDISIMDSEIRRLDHVLGNVPELGPVVQYLKRITGFHEFAEFTGEEVGTEESGLNSVALANNDENVLVVCAEPVYGTVRQSWVETFLIHNEGPGVQHFAMTSDNIFKTLGMMRKRTGFGGFEFMPPAPPTYYKNLKSRAGDVLSDDQIKECEELGILVDRDDQGTLLQIFTKPVGDRPTILIEIIQRMGCMVKDENGKEYQKGGCGGLGRGNVAELYKSVEEYEKIVLESDPNKFL